MTKIYESSLKVIPVTFCHLLSCLFDSLFVFVMFLYAYIKSVLGFSFPKDVTVSYWVIESHPATKGDVPNG